MCNSPFRKIRSGLVDFSVFAVENSSVFYCGASLSLDESDLKRFSLISDPEERDPATLSLLKAERYGGSQISRNGGGARCGFDGRYQLKGVGPNCLVGENVPYSYSNGHLPIEDALFEVLWSNILNASFPYGAVKSLAVILLDLPCKTPSGNSKRAILVREPAIRPAHFERAVYFKPKKYNFNSLTSDRERVRQVIQSINDLLPKPENLLEEKWLSLEKKDKFLLGMHEMASRFATMLAFSISKNIFHGALTSSNVAVDGRWLDFGCISMLPMRNFFETKIPKEVKEQHIEFLKCIENICFYASKYFGIEKAFSDGVVRISINAFYSSLGHNYYIYMIKELGVPDFFSNDIKNNVAGRKLVNTLEKIKVSGLGVDNYEDANIWFLNSYADRITSILLCLSFFNDSGSCERYLAKFIPQGNLRQELITEYQKFKFFISKISASNNIPFSYVNRYIAVSVLVKSKKSAKYKRNNIINTINTILSSDNKETNFHDYLEQLKRLSMVTMGDNKNRFLCAVNEEVEYDLFSDSFVIKTAGGEISISWANLFTSKNVQLIGAISFLGKNALKHIQGNVK